MWMTSYGPVEPFTVSFCLVFDKLMLGLVAVGSTFTNDKALNDKAVEAFDIKPYCRAAIAFSKTMQNIKDAVNSNKAWDNCPPLLEVMFKSHKKPHLGEIQPSWVQAGHSNFDQSKGSGNGCRGNIVGGSGGHFNGGRGGAGRCAGGRGRGSCSYAGLGGEGQREGSYDICTR